MVNITIEVEATNEDLLDSLNLTDENWFDKKRRNKPERQMENIVKKFVSLE